MTNVTLFQAAVNTATTTNGMTAFKSTLNANLDLFFKIGTARGSDISDTFDKAFTEDSDLALRILQWGRDIRGGAGERQRFRDLLLSLASKDIPFGLMKSLLQKVPEIGRYDDLHVLVGTEYEFLALDVHAKGIQGKNGLAGKWAPRKGAVANKLREVLGMSPKQYRKTIVGLTKVVETQMCANEWDEINYSHVPSVASRIYSKAFRRHDPEGYQNYIDSVISGKVKMNASAIFPYDVLRNIYSDSGAAEAQWKNLPDFLEGTDERILTVCDVSGSMTWANTGAGVTPMEVCVSLGLYFSERLEGVFKNQVMTFESNPAFVTLTGNTLSDRYRQLKAAPWGGSTNLVGSFEQLLKAAKLHNVPAEQMPTKLLIMSDMQFDVACGRGATGLDKLKNAFTEAGYVMPQVVFWNIASTDYGNVPVTFNTNGVGLVSGASPTVVQSVLGGEVDPVTVMKKTVMVDRYKL